ncbi:MAG TPA: cell wall-binding repeat-containing protein [Solirubrobacteraceae bacterium]|jgi:hypothetical protein
MSSGLRRGWVVLALAAVLAGCGKTNMQRPEVHGEPSPATPPQHTILPGSSESSGIATGNTIRVGGEGPIQDAAAVATAIYPGLTPATRPQAVVIVGSTEWPAALAASALAGAPLRAPILYGSSSGLPAATSAALAALKPTGAQALGGAQVILVGPVAKPSGYSTMTVQATDPYALAGKLATIVQRLDGNHVGAAIVAGTGQPDALAMPAAGLAAESGAPILLVEPNAVPASTTAALEALGNPPIYAIGPAASISEADIATLESSGRTTRVGGGDLVQNAIKVAAFTNGTFGWGIQEPGHGLAFARASSPFDAPAAAPLSANADYAPLLLLPSGEAVPLPLKRYLKDIQPGYTSAPESQPVRGVYNRGWVIGDTTAVSLGVQVELDALLRSVPRQSAYPSPSVAP